MPLDPQARAYLDQLALSNFSQLHTFPPAQTRQGMKRQIAQLGVPEPIAHVEDRLIDDATAAIPVRIYTPEGTGPFPILIFFHGGGFVLGDLDTHDGLCRSLANGAHCLVISVDYPLAPEHKFPAAPNACYAAVRWVAEHGASLKGDAARIVVGGDSAGGNLAAVVTHMARAKGGPELIFQLLIYPDLDFRRTNFSIQTYAGKYGNITRESQHWFMNHYLNSAEEKLNPQVSPLLAPDLAGLPPALIITAEYDALRDEGEQYGQKLKEAGVPVTITRYKGMIHEFIRHTFAQSAQARSEAALALQNAFKL
ncbi:alpha/beta hydrolase [Ktedonosporobacter rubrisoli]|uniref:Alpha/beta hydrolase n=1 Tax=Ktedonosporobacter rubrisoli TaxID=2509675 RepID=A0A4P6JMC6_KTERU|nr:alpha/beta hydrolase [Ktedonosporobacter rubrisoli]QBD76437.1 alpha/beta hydrolase [Ktedonosporobacter rubrisoli]